jgi:predicted membrane protein
MFEVIFIILTILCAVIIILYATFLLFKRLKKGERKVASFKDWIKHIVEAILGL